MESLQVLCVEISLENMTRYFVNLLSFKKFLTPLWMMLGIYGFGPYKAQFIFHFGFTSLYSFLWTVNTCLAAICSRDSYKNCFITETSGISLGVYSCPSKLIGGDGFGRFLSGLRDLERGLMTSLFSAWIQPGMLFPSSHLDVWRHRNWYERNEDFLCPRHCHLWQL